MAKCDSIPKRPIYSSDKKCRLLITPFSLSILNLSLTNAEDVLTKALLEHDRQVRTGSGNVRKDAPETSVSIVSLPDLPVLCVKHFKNRGAFYALKGLFRATHGARAFREGENLFRRGFTAAPPIALIRNCKLGIPAEEWLVMTVVPESEELDRYLVREIRKGWSRNEKIHFLNCFANFLADLHCSGIFHTDLKTCNILVFREKSHKESTDSKLETESKIGFSLLDYDDVRVFNDVLEYKRRAKNLSQLFLSTPAAVDFEDRMEFLRQYFRRCDKLRIDKKRLMEMVINRTNGKSLLYVGPEGDISEKLVLNGKRKECVEQLMQV